MIHMTTRRYVLFVGAFVGMIGAAMYPIFIYPLQNVDYYKDKQSKNRSGIKQEDIQPGNMRVWRNPFEPDTDRKKQG